VVSAGREATGANRIGDVVSAGCGATGANRIGGAVSVVCHAGLRVADREPHRRTTNGHES